MWQQLDNFDRSMMLKVQQLPLSHYWRPAARTISWSGDGAGYLLLALVFAEFGGARGLTFLLAGLAAFAFELPLYWFLKNSLKRSRPCQCADLGVMAVVQPHDKFSLPSGHSAAAFIMATLIAWYLPPLAPLAYTWATLVGLSRVMLGVHYPGDIIAGACLGFGAAQLGLSWVL